MFYQAVDIVRKYKSKLGAKIVAKHFQCIKDYKSMIEFFMIAGLTEQAFESALNYDQMGTYLSLLGEDASYNQRWFF